MRVDICDIGYNLIIICCLFLSIGSYTIQGRRVRVFQPELEEFWASGLVSHHDPISHIMEITIDKVKSIIIKTVEVKDC